MIFFVPSSFTQIRTYVCKPSTILSKIHTKKASCANWKEERNSLSLRGFYISWWTERPALLLRWDPLRGLAVIAEWHDDWDEAIKINTRLIEDYDDLLIALQARERLAECYGAKGEFDKALDQMNQILVLVPDGPKAVSVKLHIAGYQLAQGRDSSSALKLLQEIAEKYPHSEHGHEAMEILEQLEERQKEIDR